MQCDSGKLQTQHSNTYYSHAYAIWPLCPSLLSHSPKTDTEIVTGSCLCPSARSSCSCFKWKTHRLGALWLFPVLKISAIESNLCDSSYLYFFSLLGWISWWIPLFPSTYLCLAILRGFFFLTISLFLSPTLSSCFLSWLSKITMLLLFFWKPYNFFDIESGCKKSGWWRCNGLHPLWFSVHSCGPSKGGKVAKLKHTNLFLMQLFLPGTQSCWKTSP